MFSSGRLMNAWIAGLVWLVARIWVGWQFLDGGWAKLFGPERAYWTGDRAGVAVGGFLGHALDLAPGGKFAGAHPEVSGWYAGLIRHAFLPHAELLSYLVAFGDILVGLALIVGVATRFAAAMGLLMNLSYLLAGANGDGPLMVVMELALLLSGGAAGYYGIDRYLLPYLRARLTIPAWRPSPALRTGQPAT